MNANPNPAVYRSRLTPTIALERCPDTGDMEYEALMPDQEGEVQFILSGMYWTTEDMVTLDDVRYSTRYVSDEEAKAFLDDVEGLEPLERYGWEWASESEASS